MAPKRSTDTSDTDFSVDRKFSFTLRDLVTAIVSIASVCGLGAGYQVIAKPEQATVIDEATKVDLEIMQEMRMKHFADSLKMQYLITGQDEIKTDIKMIKAMIRNPHSREYGPLSMVSK